MNVILCILFTRDRLLLRLTDRFLLPIKWSKRRANWVTTHFVRFSARHHLHNVKQKTARFKILIKRAKRR